MKYKAQYRETFQVCDLPEQAVQYLSQKMDVSDAERRRLVRALTEHGYDCVTVQSGQDFGVIMAGGFCAACGRPPLLEEI